MVCVLRVVAAVYESRSLTRDVTSSSDVTNGDHLLSSFVPSIQARPDLLSYPRSTLD